VSWRSPDLSRRAAVFLAGRILSIPIPPENAVKKHALKADSLKVETFVTFTDSTDVAGTCVCDYPPCICSNGPDCTQG
jgi:hypothetical protein